MAPSNLGKMITSASISAESHRQLADHVENITMARDIVENAVSMAVDIYDIEQMIAGLPLPVPALPLSLDPYHSGVEITNLCINLKNEAHDIFNHEGVFESAQACEDHIKKIEEFAINKWQQVEGQRNVLHLDAVPSINAMQFAMEAVQAVAQLHLMQAVVPFDDALAIKNMCSIFVDIVNNL